MGRWLFRLLILGLLAGAAAFVISRLLGQEEDDFDDFDDIDAGFDFQETPVEIDVPADGGSRAEARSDATSMGTGSSTDTDASATNHKLTDISGIGPAYEARLQALGMNNVAELAQADATHLAEQLDVIGGVTTIEDWITQAKNYTTQPSEASDGRA